MRSLLATLGMTVLLFVYQEVAAADTSQVVIVIGSDAPDLERFAAAELKSIFEHLYPVDVAITTTSTATADVEILLGQATTNSHLRDASPKPLVELSDQGISLQARSENRPQLIVRGGSPVATLWAAYELGERLGVRYLHNRDVYPARQPWTGLPELDGKALEPNLRIRCWRMINELPMGPVSWSLEENQRFLRQLAKMKFNRVRLSVWPTQPFVHYSIRGVAKSKGTIYFGERFPIDDDTIGRAHFGTCTEFTNPDFQGADSGSELHRRAVTLARGIIDEARHLGMETALSFVANEWPAEFQSVLPGTHVVEPHIGLPTIEPGLAQSIDDPMLREATATVIKAYIQTYPNIDYVILTVPEFGHWVGQAEEAYRRLVLAHHVQNLDSFETLRASARNRPNVSDGGERSERQLRSDISSLWFLDSLMHDNALLNRPGGGPDIKVGYDGLVDELFPLVAQVAPAGSQIVSFVDYTASLQLQRSDVLKRVPPKELPAGVIFTLADDNVGVLPQLTTGSLHRIMELLREHQWAGFYTRYWTIGDLDPAVHFLARGSWHASLTPQEAYADQVLHVCGPAAVEPALAALAIIEKITIGLDQHGSSFGFPVPGMMTKHFDAGGMSKELKQDREMYREALRLMQQAHGASRSEGCEYTGYFVNRLQFAVRYLDAVDAYGAISPALRNGRQSEAFESANVAYVAIRDALGTYAEVARDHGDLGAIAAMNKYCYRPIRDKRNELRTGVADHEKAEK